MGSMKTGMGSDPFDDEEDVEDEDQVEDEPAEATELNETDAENSTDEGSAEQSEPALENETPTEEFPYIMRRQRVRDERPNEFSMLLREEFADLEDAIHSDVAEEMGMEKSDVSKLDLREAFVKVSADHADEIAETLNEWGYEHIS